VERPTYIAQNVLESCQMRFPWSVHVKAHLLNNIGNVGPGESHVLKCTSQAAKICSMLFLKESSYGGRQLGIGVDWGAAGLAG
jgi:hypothetical protein